MELVGGGKSVPDRPETEPQLRRLPRLLRRSAGSLGRIDEANAQTNQAIALDPVNFGSRNLLAVIAAFSRQYDLCIKLAENLGDQWTFSRGVCCAHKRMYPEAIAYMENSVARSGRRRHLGVLALVYGLAGRKSDAQKIIRQLKERSRHHYVFPTAFAYAYLGLGDKDQALTFLERACEEQDPDRFYLKMSPLLDPLDPSRVSRPCCAA
jgi:tetratricopeptide (TPR) repeat protein